MKFGSEKSISAGIIFGAVPQRRPGPVISCVCCILMAGLLCFSAAGIISYAADGTVAAEGLIYEFDKDSHYELDAEETVSGALQSVIADGYGTYGEFTISGSIINISDEDGVPAYGTDNGSLIFSYEYDDSILNAYEETWHLTEDRGRKIDNVELGDRIGKGAILIQVSNDGLNWTTVKYYTNAFEEVPVRTDPIYTTTDIQLLNGCYYRVIVCYELRILTEAKKILMVTRNNYDYKKYAEVYEFYAYKISEELEKEDTSEPYSLGTKVRTEKSRGYYGEQDIDRNDPHYGWDIGNFYVSGYTDEMLDRDRKVVFLKNVGDKVKLWFNLKENIDAIQGDPKLTVTADEEGYDRYFETDTMDFGRGALIIRYTDHNNVTGEPIIYTDYLEANTQLGADTIVQLFEEGDYEVALDYEITRDGLKDTVGHYRIFFEFSVRNSNCMVYPFDVLTGEELTNSSMTENGFRLDLAKSRYLKINMVREVMKNSADGLVQDTRFNGSARDGAEYTDEGIYTITVSNLYTGANTEKKIYVGSDSVMRAHMATGLSISEINSQVAEGAVIEEDGSITPPETEPETEPETAAGTLGWDGAAAEGGAGAESAGAGYKDDGSSKSGDPGNEGTRQDASDTGGGSEGAEQEAVSGTPEGSEGDAAVADGGSAPDADEDEPEDGEEESGGKSTAPFVILAVIFAFVMGVVYSLRKQGAGGAFVPGNNARKEVPDAGACEEDNYDDHVETGSADYDSHESQHERPESGEACITVEDYDHTEESENPDSRVKPEDEETAITGSEDFAPEKGGCDNDQ